MTVLDGIRECWAAAQERALEVIQNPEAAAYEEPVPDLPKGMTRPANDNKPRHAL